MIKSAIVAGLGGFIGTVLRFLSNTLGEALCYATFPVGTFIANMAGCFLIGLFYGWVSKRAFMTKRLNIFLITGLCGGFTTFSTFSGETLGLIEKGDAATFIFYLPGSIIFGLIMVAAGIACVSDKPRSTNTQAPQPCLKQ